MPSKLTLLAVPTLLGLCALGLRYTLLLGFHNGLFAIIGASAQGTLGAPFPAGPAPFVRTFTGIAPVDRMLMDLVAYFTILMQGEQSWGTRVSWIYMMAQLYGLWTVVNLEGYREGNRGKLISHTSILGLFFQTLSLAFTLPLYCILHLLTTPRQTTPTTYSTTIPRPDRLAAPLAGFLSFTLPALIMGLPTSRSTITSPWIYYAIALWQIFPLSQSLWHHLCRLLVTPSPNKDDLDLPTAYSDAFRQSLTSHLLLLLLFLLAPSPYLPSSLLPYTRTITPSAVLLPYTFTNTPVVTVASLASMGPEGDAAKVLLTKLAQTFLLWDLYCSSATYLVWVMVQGVRGGSGFFRTAGRVVFWTIIGGPGAAGAVVLSHRDRKNILVSHDKDV